MEYSLLQHILIIEQDDQEYEALQSRIISEYDSQIKLTRCASAAEAMKLNSNVVSVALMCIDNEEHGMEAFVKLQEKFAETPVIVLCNVYEETSALRFIQNGAHDYLEKAKPDNLFLIRTLRHSVERQRKSNEVKYRYKDYKHFFDDSPNPQWIYEEGSLKFLAVNNAAITCYGYSGEEFMNMTIKDIRPLEDVHLLKRIMLTRDADKSLHNAGCWRHKRKNGEVFYAQIYSHFTKFEGKLARIVTAFDVTEKAKVERQNKELDYIVNQQKEQLNDIMSSVNDVVWSRRADDSTLVYINKACEKVFGYTAEEMMTGDGGAFDHIHPDDISVLNEQIHNTLVNGNGKLEYRVYDKEGNIKYISAHGTLKKGAEGMPDLINGVSVDITKEKLYENELKETAKKIEQILGSITDGFFSISRAWRFTYANRAFETLFGIGKEEVIGKLYWEVFPKWKDFEFYYQYTLAMTENRVVHFEEHAPHMNKWLSLNVYPSDEGLNIFFKDITERKTLQDKIAKDERNLRGLINNTTDLIWAVDKDCRITAINEAFVNHVFKMMGTKPSIGDNVIDDTFDEAVKQRWSAFYRRALNGESLEISDESILNGESIFMEIYLNPITDNNRIVTGCSCFARDITERKKHLMRIELQNERLQEIAWIQSHVVRSPVATILGLVDIFNYAEPADESNKEILEGIKTATSQLDDIIKEIVEKTRMLDS